MIQVVGIGVATGNGEDACAQDIDECVRDAQRIAVIRDHGGQRLGQPELPVRPRQQHHTTLGAEASAIERGGDLLAANGW
jgi:hypothetical protein